MNLPLKMKTMQYTKSVFVKGFSVLKKKQETTQDNCKGKCKWHGMKGIKNWHRCFNCGTEELI